MWEGGRKGENSPPGIQTNACFYWPLLSHLVAVSPCKQRWRVKLQNVISFYRTLPISLEVDPIGCTFPLYLQLHHVLCISTSKQVFGILFAGRNQFLNAKTDFNQQMAYGAPVGWSKYTAAIQLFFFLVNVLLLILCNGLNIQITLTEPD